MAGYSTRQTATPVTGSGATPPLPGMHRLVRKMFTSATLFTNSELKCILNITLVNVIATCSNLMLVHCL